jgi:predicted RNA-binding Zn-ribbon protein involved in translation (DUF1610 family)
MPRTKDELLAEYQARYTVEERGLLQSAILASALRETPCSTCGRAAFAVEPGDGWSRFECPYCHEVIWIGGPAEKLTVLSGRRRVALLRAATRRAWYCPDHDGVRVRLTAIETDPANPTIAMIHFLCRRSRGVLQGGRVHTGTLPVNLLALESQ